MTSAPFGSSDNQFTPAQQKRGEKFEQFLNKAQDKYGQNSIGMFDIALTKLEKMQSKKDSTSKAPTTQPKSDKVTILPTKKSAAKAGLPKKPAPKKK